MRPVGHSLSDASGAWMAAEGFHSMALLSRRSARWCPELRLGEQPGELPWDLICSEEDSIFMDERACMRRVELRASGVRSAALVSSASGQRAWITSKDPSWRPSAALRATLAWLGTFDAVSAEQTSTEGRSGRAETVAHDLRNQLSLALLRLEMVEAVGDGDVASVRGALRSGRAMCNAFLAEAEPSADQALLPLIEEELRGAMESLGARDVTVSLRCGANVLVNAPEGALRRFLHNALMNGLEASPDGSRLLVEAVSAGRGKIDLAIEDAGPGLSSEGVADAFSSGSSGRGSTGLGSESLRFAAEALGCPLQVSSAVGRGTRVSVCVSAARSDRPVAVLLDSDPSLAAIAKVALEDRGWWVVAQSSADSAVGALDRMDASLGVARRGAPGGGGDALRSAASDLGVPFAELREGDDGAGLPDAPDLSR